MHAFGESERDRQRVRPSLLPSSLPGNAKCKNGGGEACNGIPEFTCFPILENDAFHA